MAHVPTNPIGRCLRRLAVAHLVVAAPDDELVQRFAVHRDQAAFTALVRRHGSLVLGVCRRLLAETHAADDCFQATFLVLARKAGSLKRPEALRPWLYGVATRTALQARPVAGRGLLWPSEKPSYIPVLCFLGAGPRGLGENPLNNYKGSDGSNAEEVYRFPRAVGAGRFGGWVVRGRERNVHGHRGGVGHVQAAAVARWR
jgi:hypothetical protein